MAKKMKTLPILITHDTINIMNKNIRNLQVQIEREERFIRNCKHDFSEAKYNAEEYKEPYYTSVAHGSDVWGEVQGYTTKHKDRWSRKCSICGYEQHTYTKKPIISGHEPNFD